MKDIEIYKLFADDLLKKVAAKDSEIVATKRVNLELTEGLNSFLQKENADATE